MPDFVTPCLPIDPARPAPDVIARAAAILRAGGLVAFPTETVYGLGANALDEAAVGRIFVAKERATSDPLIVHLADAAELPRVAREAPPAALALAKVLWPGPLTLVLPRAAAVPANVSAGLDTVAVRVPSHPVARALIHAAGVPLAAPSANRFTRTSATTAAHVLADLDGRIDLVLDGGPADAGIESTVVAVEGSAVVVLRPGAVTAEALADAVHASGLDLRVEFAAASHRAASPGMMEKHYAPRARLTYVRGPREVARERLRALVGDAVAGGRTGVLVPSEDVPLFAALGARVEDLGPETEPETAAHRLYAALRALDAAGATAVFARQPGAGGIARALDDRLRRAASEVIEVA